MRLRPKKRVISIDEWSRDFGTKLALQVVTAVIGQKDKVGPENFRMLFQTFIAGFISATVNTIMREIPSNQGEFTQQELLKYAEDNFQDLKCRIQDAVGAGFQAGVLSWSGQQIEYYALIKPVPEPVNTKPC